NGETGFNRRKEKYRRPIDFVGTNVLSLPFTGNATFITVGETKVSGEHRRCEVSRLRTAASGDSA
ncbi:MAG TPA: hypothetical protein PLR74_06385, partial [Agriterribacter sp.]|nr:hypothetical protein [Agriterribacter sp.]